MPAILITVRSMSAVNSPAEPNRFVTYCGKNRNTIAIAVTAQSMALLSAIMLKRRGLLSGGGAQQSSDALAAVAARAIR